VATGGVLDRAGLDQLVNVLRADGYRVIGLTLRDGAIVLAEIDSGAELPAGWGVETAPGATGRTAVTMQRCFPTLLGRSRGSSSCIRRASRCGRPTA
jgi:hypothetical protein